MDVKLKYYLNEETCENKTTSMEIVGNVGVGKNETQKVSYFGSETGFYKNSSLNTSGMLDDLEFFLSIVGKHILDFDIAETLKVYDTDDNAIGIISKNVAKENESLVMFSEVTDAIVKNKNPEIEILYNQVIEMRKRTGQTFYHSNGQLEVRPVLEDEKDIMLAINMFPLSLDYTNINENEKEQIKKDYFKMIVFDLLINQADRNNSNYGIIRNTKTQETRFSTLFDNSTIHIPGIPENYYNLNGCLIDRKQMLICLIDNYPEYVSDIINPIVDNQESILSRTEKVATSVLTPKEQGWVMPLFKNNLETMKEVTLEKRNHPKV